MSDEQNDLEGLAHQHQQEREQRELEELRERLKQLPAGRQRKLLMVGMIRNHEVNSWQLEQLWPMCDSTGFDLAIAHLEAQIVSWRMTNIPPEHALDMARKGIEALKQLTLNPQ